MIMSVVLELSAVQKLVQEVGIYVLSMVLVNGKAKWVLLMFLFLHYRSVSPISRDLYLVSAVT
jgi:hypothetical protein